MWIIKNLNPNHHNSFKQPPYLFRMEEDKLKMAIISGASHALKYKQENPNSSTDEIIRRITKEANSIIDKLDTDTA